MVKPPSIDPKIIVPEVPAAETVIFCHRFYVPMAIPKQDALDPRKATMVPQVANVSCCKERCMLWNEKASECWEKSAFRAQAEIAYVKANDISASGS